MQITSVACVGNAKEKSVCWVFPGTLEYVQGLWGCARVGWLHAQVLRARFSPQPALFLFAISTEHLLLHGMVPGARLVEPLS